MLNNLALAALARAAGTSDTLAATIGKGAVIGIIAGGLTVLLLRWISTRSIGTRSVLYGAHCFFLHPFFVAAAWYQLWGFRKVTDKYVGEISLWNPRLWIVFLVHDLGYIGKKMMDDPEGETHPIWGARFIQLLARSSGWYFFSLLHSRYYAKTLEMQPSLLCVADKLSLAITPSWIYLPMVRATGEIEEYMRMDLARRAAGENRREITYAEEQRIRERELLWHRDVQKYMRDWVEKHKDGSEDTWTKSQLFKDATARTPITESGVTA